MNMRRIRKMAALIYFYVYNRLISVFCAMDENTVVFLTDARDRIDGNLKAIYDFMEKSNCDYKKIVFTRGDKRKAMSFRQFKTICRVMTCSKYILLDDFYGLTSAMRLRKNQKLIQLWHGSGAYKKFGFSRLSSDLSGSRVHGGYRKYTGVTVSSEGVRECFAEAFDIPLDRVEALGSPRTDVLFDIDYTVKAKSKLIEKYPKLEGKKIILFAPTYRGGRVEQADYDFDKLSPKELMNEISGSIILVRWHPALLANIKNGTRHFDLPEGMIDVSEYEDINELIASADVLITDYSSIIFDWFITKKPIVFYLYDMGEYEGARGLYFELEEYIYGTLAVNFDELVDAIKTPEFCSEKRDEFNRRFMMACDGRSCEKVCKWIFEEELRYKGEYK